MKNVTYFLTLFLLSTLFCCSQSSEVEASFNRIVAASENFDREKVAANFSIASMKYFSSLAKVISSGSAADAERLGNRYGVPLTTLEAFYLASPPLEDTITSDISAETLLGLSILMGSGIFRSAEAKPISIYDSAEVDSEKGTADLPVKVPTGVGNASVLSTYTFSNENGSWKLDYVSTLSMKEKILAQNRSRSKMSNQDFISAFIHSSDQKMSFKYRQ